MQIGRNALYNLLGLGVPLLVAVFTIPALLHRLGTAQFGMLTLIWAVVGTFSLLDLGLGRALTLHLASAKAHPDDQRVGAIVVTAGALMFALGLMAALALMAAAPWAVAQVHGIGDETMAARALLILALALPAVVLTAWLRGILEARQAFADVNLVRLPMGVFTFLGPLLAVWLFGARLDAVAAMLCCGRWVGLAAHVPLVRRRLNPAERHGRIDPRLIGPLLTTGGWLTVSNVVSQFMGYVDRFALAALASATAVAFYATPLEVVSKLWIIPGAVTAVLFPAFASLARHQQENLLPLFRTVIEALLLATLPLTAGIALFAHELLSLWLDPAFADASAPWLQVFALGMTVNALAHVPYTLIQSTGNAKLTALIHLSELPLFALGLWVSIPAYGIGGAAGMWFARMVLDTILMMAVCLFTLGWSVRRALGRQLIPMLAFTGAAFAGVAFSSAALRALWFVTLLVLCGARARAMWMARSKSV
jgi:O-antigen/teichoic acid export membrane protein